MGDTLDLCSRYADAATLPALIPRLSALVKRGTGLNTRVGTARFIVSLALRLGMELRPQSGALIKVGSFCVSARSFEYLQSGSSGYILGCPYQGRVL